MHVGIHPREREEKKCVAQRVSAVEEPGLEGCLRKDLSIYQRKKRGRKTFGEPGFIFCFALRQKGETNVSYTCRKLKL